MTNFIDQFNRIKAQKRLQDNLTITPDLVRYLFPHELQQAKSKGLLVDIVEKTAVFTQPLIDQGPPPAPTTSPQIGPNEVTGGVKDKLNPVRHYPDIGIKVLNKKLSSAYRIWLLFGCLDNQGGGYLPIDLIRESINGLGWFNNRRLNQVIKEGEGVFWRVERNGRFLAGLEKRSPAKVAHNLGLFKMSKRPVLLPSFVFKCSLADFNAYIFASWFNRKEDNPISQESIYNQTQIPIRTQYEYIERVDCLSKEYQFAIHTNTPCNDYHIEAMKQERKGVFVLLDRKGKHGAKGKRYIATRLPNLVTSNLSQANKGRMKKDKRQLSDLVNNGVQGSRYNARLYYQDAKQANRAFNRLDSGQEIFYKNPSSNIWYPLLKQENYSL